MEQMERKSPLSDLMRTAMEKVHEMVDTKSIVGEPIVGAITEKNQAETLQSLIDQAIAADAG